MMRVAGLATVVVVVVAASLLVGRRDVAVRAEAGELPALMSTGEAAAGGGSALGHAQDEPESPARADDEDQRVPVQVWTVFAAGVAMGLGLLGFLLRAVMGWVKPPPPQEEAHH
jgi:hypothetical protein